jgi:hypothetical protein
MPGANYGLSKGFLATGSNAYAIGEAIILVASASVVNPAQCLRASSATGLALGVCEEALDAAKVTTGKAIVAVKLTGIAKCIAGGVVAPGDNVTSDANGKFVATTTPNDKVWGIALNAANTAANDIFDVMLTPGTRYSNA